MIVVTIQWRDLDTSEVDSHTVRVRTDEFDQAFRAAVLDLAKEGGTNYDVLAISMAIDPTEEIDP